MLPPTAVTLLPDEDSWSARAKQFLRRDSFLRRAKASKTASPAKGQPEKDAPTSEQPASLSEGRLNSADTNDTLMGASPRSDADPREFSSEPQEQDFPQQDSQMDTGPSGRLENNEHGAGRGRSRSREQQQEEQGESGGTRGKTPQGLAESWPAAQQRRSGDLALQLPRLPPLRAPVGEPPPPPLPPASPRRDRASPEAEADRAMSPRSEARRFMASVSGYVSSTEGAGGAKMRRPGWWRGPAVTSWTQYRIERSRLPASCSPILARPLSTALLSLFRQALHPCCMPSHVSLPECCTYSKI